MLRRLALTTSAMLVLAAALSSTASATFSISAERLWLDTRSVGTPAPPSAQTTKPLVPGGLYFAQVTGNYSLWSVNEWNRGLGCGSRDTQPMFPSPGVPNGPAAVDAATIYGAPTSSYACTPEFGQARGPVPTSNYLFQIDTGAGFVPRDPVTGKRKTPNFLHSYTYLLQGTGTPASFAFRSNDGFSSDNYGRLRIDVIGLTKDDCKNGGWAAMGGKFKNQGDCISWGNHQERWFGR